MKARDELLSRRTIDGHWIGELSSSALSTATAVTALAMVGRHGGLAADARAISAGLTWLAQHQNADGGWGDTTLSISNISTTTLVWAAFGAVPGVDERHGPTIARVERWLTERAGALSPDRLAQAIIARYGKDRTFSVPILTMCALAGRLGAGREAWRHVMALPFELAALPHQLFAAVRLPVVSYALPALIAIGQARHYHAPSANPFARVARILTRGRSLRVLTGLQPGNGGFLEATPLTSFVTLSLAGSGQADHIVARKGVEFLRASQRADGSWPIDTNLATWVSTLAVNALGPDVWRRDPAAAERLRTWLMAQQYRIEHPYTHAAPGGWAWTPLPGGVPDADDTAGALVALHQLGCADDAGKNEPANRDAAQAGLQWLLELQNRDGGIPTFCRGWGALPFDRSSPDITAHAVRAWLAWEPHVPAPLARRLVNAAERALAFLERGRRPNGSWVPLWFGNQFAPEDENPVYGTSRVVCALGAGAGHANPRIRRRAERLLEPACTWLARVQNEDGGWGGACALPSTIEETALAVEALALAEIGARHPGALERTSASDQLTPFNRTPLPLASARQRGAEWLARKVTEDDWRQPAPIGFYFAKLWYFEQLYPLVFTTGALRQALAVDRPKFGCP